MRPALRVGRLLATSAIAVCLSSAWAAGVKKDDLFDLDTPAEAAPATVERPSAPDAKSAETAVPTNAAGSAWHGFAQAEIAGAYRDPGHWTKARLSLDLNRQGQLFDGLKWKIGGRINYDGVYDRSNWYPSDVRKDERYSFSLRENYLDWTAGDWDFRLGRQHVVWGEMVGLFFADVVSARDLREFYLPEFEVLRIPQWAIRGEYFSGDTHTELIWIPVPSYDEIGRAGGDFYPYVGSFRDPRYYLGEQKPANTLANTNYGVRFSSLNQGWDLSGFAYHGQDVAPTLFRVGNGILFQPRHVPINQLGSTLGKDLGVFVLKGEAVYTQGRKFNSLATTQPDGVVGQNTLDYALGLDFSYENETRLNLQFFQRVYFAHDPNIGPDAKESGVSVLINGKPIRNVETQLMLIYGLNRGDSMIRPRVSWNFDRNWRWMVGADVFNGQQYGMFGQYYGQSRLYSELRYSF